jgi:hypothetical protein
MPWRYPKTDSIEARPEPPGVGGEVRVPAANQPAAVCRTRDPRSLHPRELAEEVLVDATEGAALRGRPNLRDLLEQVLEARAGEQLVRFGRTPARCGFAFSMSRIASLTALPTSRTVLQKVLVGRVVFTPDEAGTGYTFEAATRFDKLFAGCVVPVHPSLRERVDASGGWQRMEGLESMRPEDCIDYDYDKLLENFYDKGLASPEGFGRVR